MPQAIVPLISTITAVATTGAGIAGFTFLGFSAGWSSVFAAFATFSVLGYAATALAPSLGATIKNTQQTGAGYTANPINSSAPAAYVYGKTRVGGVVFYQETSNNALYLSRLIALAAHEINSVQKIMFNDEEITLDSQFNVISPSKYVGVARVKTYLGLDDQEADRDLLAISGRWTSDHRAQGIAYLYVRFKYNADSFPNGIPVVTAVIEGKKVYNPITETTEYSNNSALCLRDYLLTSGVAESEEINDSLFVAAANVCDESVSLSSGGVENRYTANGVFTSDISPQNAIQNILSSMGGMIWYSQGKWGCKAAYYSAPSVSLNEDDLRTGLQIQTRNSRRDGFNKITGIFKGAESNYFETNYPTVDSDVFLAVDNGMVSEMEMNLPFTSTSSMAQRIAKIALYRNREQLKISGSFGMNAMKLSVGDLVEISNSRMGWTDKVFEVVEWRFGLSDEMALEVYMTLQEISSAVFEWDAEESVFETNNTVLLSPFYVPALAINETQDYRIINEHITNVLEINVSSDFPDFVDYVEVQYKKSTDSEYKVLGIGDIGVYELLDIDTPLAGSSSSITYSVRARAFNSLGIKGEFTYRDKIVAADTTPPQPVTNFDHQLSGGTLFFNWNASADLDLSYYKLYHSSSTSATFGDGTNSGIINKIARPATSVTYPAISGTFFLEPYDKTGNGGQTASLVVLPSELPALGTTSEDVENPDFLGTKTNTTVVSNELQLSTYDTAPSTGCYEFDGYIDTGSIRTARIFSELTMSRSHADAVNGDVNWDAIPQNWDTWSGNWDTWTAEDAPFNDFAVTIYVSTTADDPSASPTWGAWLLAAGEVTGRAFKFKAELSSSSNNITPSISVLKGIAEY